MSPEMRRTLAVIQDYPQELDFKATIQLDPERAERINLTVMPAELFQILVLKPSCWLSLSRMRTESVLGHCSASTTAARQSRRPSGTTGMCCTRGPFGNRRRS